MSNWIKNLINKVAGNDPEPQPSKEVKDNGWISGVMNINEDEISQEENDAQAEMEEVRGVKKEAGAYAVGDSEEDTIDKDYELRIKHLSDYNLMEMLLEYDLREKGLATTVQAEAKDKMKKYVEGNRSAAEKKLLDHLGTHSKLDVEKAFEKFKKEEEVKHPSEEDLRKPEFKTGDQNWEKKVDYSAPSDKEKLEAEKEHGVGHEEEKGQVGKEASESTDAIRKKVVKKIKDVIEEELSDKVVMEKEDAVKEHENLVDVLKSPSHTDDKPEAKKQEDELKEYKEASKVTKCIKCNKEMPIASMVENTHGAGYLCKTDVPEWNKEASEIKSKVTKEAALSKIAEVESPWYVVEDEKGEKHIAKRKKTTNKKESNEDKPNVR